MFWRCLVLLALTVIGCGPRVVPPTTAPARAARIVSLTPSLTELLFELGAGPRVVGVTANDHYPAVVRDLPKVGDIQLDYEALLALKPDLVVYDAGFNAEQGNRLKQLGLRVLEVRSSSLEGLEAALSSLGEATGCQERSKHLLARWRAQLARVRAHAATLEHPPSLFVEIWGQPLMTAGNGTFVNQLIAQAGGRNVFGDRSGYPTVSTEALLERNPDLIILTVSTPEQASAQPGWSGLAAVKCGRVHRIDSDLLVRPTLRCAEALQLIQGWLAEGT